MSSEVGSRSEIQKKNNLKFEIEFPFHFFSIINISFFSHRSELWKMKFSSESSIMNFMIVLFHIIRGVAVAASVVKFENWQGCAAAIAAMFLTTFPFFHFHARFSFHSFHISKEMNSFSISDLVSLIQLKHFSPSRGRKLGNFNFSTRALFILSVFLFGANWKETVFFQLNKFSIFPRFSTESCWEFYTSN